MRTYNVVMAAVLLTVPLFASIPAQPTGRPPAHPGMLNYVEGQAKIDGKPVTNQNVGGADVEQGQVIETGQGKAEILLTPGVFLRLGSNSAVRMVSAGLANTQVELLRGEAMVEATDIRPANHIQIIDHGIATTLNKNGLYAFRADQPQVAVYDGKATVTEGDQHQDVKKGHEEELAGLQVTKFDTKHGDELYQWSDLRSEYLSEASVSSARTYLVGPGWYGGGWYWNNFYGFYSFLPGDGFLYSPFGWGFYGPRSVGFYPGFGYRAGYGGYGYGGGVYNRGFVAGNRGAGAAPHAAAFAGGGGSRGGGGRR
jgi:hypothetical protein